MADLQRAHLDATLLHFSSPLLQCDRANIAAVGSFEPGIELWDMDVVRGRSQQPQTLSGMLC